MGKRKASVSPPDVCSPAKKSKKGLSGVQESSSSPPVTLPPGARNLHHEFSQCSSSLRKLFDDVKDLLDQKKSTEELCHEGVVTLSKMISLCRSSVATVTSLQQDTHKSMLDLDTAKLKLQNMQYEQSNLQRKIEEARNSPIVPVVHLLSEDDFHRNAPEHLTALASQSDHKCHLARLQYEALHRAQLGQELKSSQRQIATVTKDIGACERQQETVKTEMRRLLEVGKSFEKKVHFQSSSSPSSPPPSSVTADLASVPDAEHLPEPLYLLAKKAHFAGSLKDHCEISVTVLEDSPLGTLQGSRSIVGEARSKCTELPNADDIAFVEPHRYSCLVSVTLQVAADEIGKNHSGSHSPVYLHFHYIPNLMLVSVDHNLVDSDVLDHVTPGDDGMSSPKFLSSSPLQRPFAQLSSLAERGALGRLYVWAQQLAGIDYLPCLQPKHKDESVSSAACCWSTIVQHLAATS